ncbi:condensin complex subunit 2 [Nematocida sp. LUAm3]|nr:condensin complex subunit 2 [Nematocida sp. LUAm3]KAI5175416.1 condensin complex subunit 2 [Nematocida sp. LUAm2]KAI5177627.1 condensin complex subunit 2 [Nematocida sp. LUAm1]
MQEKESIKHLKESSEGKITQKTAWSSTLIEDFSNVERFQETSEATNFQQASIWLEGCVKLYGTRVDNVVSGAEILMESIGRVKEKERQKTKIKVHPTIEQNPESLSLQKKRVFQDYEIVEYLVRESKEGDTRGLLMNLLKWSDKNGLQLMKRKEDGSMRNDSPIAPVDLSLLKESFYLGEHRKNISPLFANFTPDKSLRELELPTYAYQISYDEPLPIPQQRFDLDLLPEATEAPEEYIYHPMDALQEEEISPEHGEQAPAHIFSFAQKQERRLSVTPFGYFKGWAGPAHWKMQSRHRKHKEREQEKERKRHAIDFVQDDLPSLSIIFEKDEKTVLTPQQITERRANKHMLPAMFSITPNDLYSMLTYPNSTYPTIVGSKPSDQAPLQYNPSRNCFNASEPQEVDREEQETYDICLPVEQDCHMLENQENPQENIYSTYSPHMDMSQEKEYLSAPHNALSTQAATHASSLLSRRLLQSVLRRARKNDVIQVKNHLWQAIEKGEKEIEAIYSEVKEKDVSAPFYLVSLLHLANEKNLRIVPSSSEDMSSAPSHFSQLLLMRNTATNAQPTQ